MLKSTVYQEKKLYYQITGKGKPVVLLHGFGEDGSVFDGQVSFLEKYCQVIVPHFPGMGLSDYNPAIESIEAFAKLVLFILDEESIATCVLLGHSMGGYITLAFVEAFPHRVEAFGLLHSTAFADTAEKKQQRDRGIAIMEQYGGSAFLRNTIPNLFSSLSKQTMATQIETLIRKTEVFETKALQLCYKAMRDRPDRTSVLKSSKLPVCIIMGEEDIAAPLQDVLQQTFLANCSYIHVMRKVGHMGMLEETAVFNQYLLDFIHR